MSLYIAQIRQLVSLQAVDDDIFLVDQELQQAPKHIAELEASFLVIEQQRTRGEDKMSHLLEQQKRITNEIEEDAARLKKSKNKMTQVSTSREYQAIGREMDTMERLSQIREQDKTALEEELTNHTVYMDEVMSKWEVVNSELEIARTSLDERLVQSQKRRAELEERRRQAGAEVPRPVLERYEFIRHRLAHPVIVPVKNGVCDGCHISIPPQIFIELQGGDKILNCPNCQRLIYWCEHFAPKEEVVAE